MTPNDFRSLYVAEFPPPTERELQLDALAREYYRRTEEYDRTVCTGPVTRDGIIPATSRERGLINRFAAAAWRDLMRQAEQFGATYVEMRKVCDRTLRTDPTL